MDYGRAPALWLSVVHLGLILLNCMVITLSNTLSQRIVWPVRPGITTTDDFQNAEVLYAETLPAVRAALTRAPGGERAIPVVTGFLGRGINTGGRAAAACEPQCL